MVCERGAVILLVLFVTALVAPITNPIVNVVATSDTSSSMETIVLTGGMALAPHTHKFMVTSKDYVKFDASGSPITDTIRTSKALTVYIEGRVYAEKTASSNLYSKLFVFAPKGNMYKFGEWVDILVGTDDLLFIGPDILLAGSSGTNKYFYVLATSQGQPDGKQSISLLPGQSVAVSFKYAYRNDGNIERLATVLNGTTEESAIDITGYYSIFTYDYASNPLGISLSNDWIRIGHPEADVYWKAELDYLMIRSIYDNTSTEFSKTVTDVVFLADPTFFDGTNYIDIVSNLTGTISGNVVRVEAEEKWVWKIQGLYNDNLVHLLWFNGWDIIVESEEGTITYENVSSTHLTLEFDMLPRVARITVDWINKVLKIEPLWVGLPEESILMTHEIVYSPNSTQFIHTFTAVNTSTAGYETNYTDAYGWRVYANPYDSTVNNASLISEINITLPYTKVLVENITLYTKSNGTGDFRQLWIKVLNSSGGVIVELTNATIGTNWTEVVLPINVDLSGQIIIWINATVKSSTTVGEEVAVKDVRVYTKYDAKPQVIVAWTPNVDYFNCSAKHYVELGSSEYLNSSVIIFKLIQFLTYNVTVYSVQPMFIGNETIGSYNYSVYRVEPANYSQNMTIYALLENKLKTFKTHARGFDTETVLVGEPLSIELPEPGNITVVELNETFINVTSVTLRFSSVGTFTIEANLTQPSLWKLGYGTKTIIVKYGAFDVEPVDVDSRVVNYEDLVLWLVNKTSGAVIKELAGNTLFSLDNLWAGNYSVVVKFKDVVIGTKDFELNITTDASAIDIPCTMRILKDYRGLNRSIVYEHDKQLMDVESLSTKYPYSRMKFLLNGTGSFKLYINYRGDLPTKVRVVGNVTSLKYYWDGNYLVITGTLGSVRELNITDLYKVRLEIYDRLGNLMPSWVYVYINETKYSGSVVEDYYYPEDYVVELPKTINGFKFYGFFDGYNETTRAISINNSDVTLRVWYRVPTTVKEVKSYQVASLWWIPFIKQDSDRVKVYVEGYLLDYYGYGVPNRPIAINITDVELGFTWTINVTTDATGYFRTPILELVRGRIYRIDVDYSGDDIYIGSYSTMEIKPEELPTAPVAPEIPTEYYIMAVVVVLIIIGIAVATIRAVRHTVEDLRARTRKFVKKK